MPDPVERQALPDQGSRERFSIRWRADATPGGSGYLVSLPNYNGGEVVTAEAYDRLRAENERLREALASTTMHTCREWCDEKANYCHAPAEFLIWGKLTPPNGLGPRCYDHAAEHVGHRALGDPSWAIVDLRPARSALACDEGEAS